ncbi:SURF1 family cytochrome oxidase biogenesis protein [Microbacterium caowuchunii]|uniref:SURF1-like protein n=1 Tax=Microbacterium caowuchunii TaxID=2614638 RepID=A0A5N0TJ11_9MICO|nr:SURF1 family protein [Microbacterium caowuchunii]KAA9135090.1 SURF1 family protein [Microbacterium caowuchunii]
MNLKTATPAVRWSVYGLVGVLFAVVCVFLADWQFSRNDERSAQLALVERNYDAAPVALDVAVSADGSFDPEREWQPVALTGTYLTEDELVVRNRPHGGTSAFEVLTPFRTDDGRIVIVDRGWVPPAESGEGTADIPAPPEGEITVVVRLRPSEPLPPSGRSAPAGQVPTIHLPLIAGSTGSATVTSAYGILAAEDAVTETPVPLTPPSEDPGPHLSYAIQWILFAIMGFVFIGYIIRTELRHRAEDAQGTQDDAPHPDTPAEPVVRALRDGSRPPRRGRATRRPDQDMADEDALLDRVDY